MIDRLAAVAENDPVAMEEARRGLPGEDAARSVPRRSDWQRPRLGQRAELIRLVEAARETQLDPLSLLHVDRRRAAVTGRHDLRQLPVTAGQQDCDVIP